MLIPGIKIGPKNWHDRIAARPKCVEVWFRLDQANTYHPALKALHDAAIPFGLHFWGVTTSGHEANLAYPGKLRHESIQMMRECLRIAHDWQATYVNIHSGNRQPINLSLNDGVVMTADPEFPAIPDREAITLRNQALEELGRYAHQQQTILLVELIPHSTINHPLESQPVPEYPASPTGLLDLCKRHLIGFTNDFCHTFSRQINQPRSVLYQDFLAITQSFLPYTQLCHINTLGEPYNGTDAHYGILDSDFARTGVFPSQSEFIDLFKMYQMLPSDTWLIGEPSGDHVTNYHALCDLIAQL